MQRGQRTQRLAGQLPFAGHHRQLATLARDHPALDQDEIAEIDVGLPTGQPFGAHLGEAQHDLQPFTVVVEGEAVLKGCEAELAGVADEHDAPTHRHDVLGLLAGGQAAPAGAHLGESLLAAQLTGVGFPPLVENALALVETHLRLLSDFAFEGSGVGVLQFVHLLSLPRRRVGTNSAAGQASNLATTG